MRASRYARGIAGPRMFIAADSGADGVRGWDLLVPLPERLEEGAIRVTHLPAGRYHVFHHLIGTDREYTRSTGGTGTFNTPIDAWGGTPVTLLPAATTEIPEFSEGPLGEVRIRLLDRSGTPVATGVLRIRDRMYESWATVVAGGTTLRMAEDPIPEPPSVSIDNGLAVFDSVRPGRLGLLLILDDGRTVSFTRDVDLNGINEVSLPFDLR